VRLGAIGGALGVTAGLAELLAGPAIRSWVGDKEDTTRLGIATVALAAVALASALAVSRRPTQAASGRFLLALAFLLPGLICFTTVGRLWYVPGALLVTAGAIVLAGVWDERQAIAVAAERNWTALLVAVLGLVYVFLGATALGVSGLFGLVGGLTILTIVVRRDAISAPLALVLLIAATVPFAALTWWSVATPLTGALLLVIGVPVLARHHRGSAPPSDRVPTPHHNVSSRFGRRTRAEWKKTAARRRFRCRCDRERMG
jgi:hypothetical protein